MTNSKLMFLVQNIFYVIAVKVLFGHISANAFLLPQFFMTIIFVKNHLLRFFSKEDFKILTVGWIWLFSYVKYVSENIYSFIYILAKINIETVVKRILSLLSAFLTADYWLLIILLFWQALKLFNAQPLLLKIVMLSL